MSVTASRYEELCHFSILIEQYRIFNFVGVRNLIAVEGTNIWFVTFISDWKKCISYL